MLHRARLSLLLTIAACVTLVVYLFIPLHGSADEEPLKANLRIFSRGLDIIQKNYYKSPDEAELGTGSLQGLCGGLDPHSQFMDEEVYRDMKVETQGEFGGLGIEITIRDSALTIVAPIEDTPAFRMGLRAADRIVEIEGEPTKDLTLMEAVRKLRGTPGTTVNITVMRPGSGELLPFSITREIIQIQSVKDAGILQDGIGYVKLTQFNEHTGRDLETALQQMEKEGLRALILDLRNNPGGLLQVAIEVADKFIGEEKLLVYTESRNKTQNIEFTSHERSTHPNVPLVILVNKGSASGSEIVAGAVQDWHRGIILGSTTFGKGSVQTVLPLKDGSGLRLTTAKYFTPQGRCIDKVGIEPDIRVELSDEEEIKLIFKKRLERMIEEAPNEEDLVKEREELEKLEDIRDTQLERALELLKGLLVYEQSIAGEGG